MEVKVTQADIDRADKVGWLTMERRTIVAEEFAAHRCTAIEDCKRAVESEIESLGNIVDHADAQAYEALNRVVDRIRNMM